MSVTVITSAPGHRIVLDLSLHLAYRCDAVGWREDNRGQVDGFRFLLFYIASVQQALVQAVRVAQRERLAELLGPNQLFGLA